MSALWLIYHIPKTGGQTIRNHLAGELERGIVYLHLGKLDLETALTYEDIAALDAETRSRVRVMSGHPLERRFADLFPGRPIREVVFIRDPASRFVSHYNFSMTMRSRRGDPPIDFEQYLDEQPENFMTGALARFFGVRDRPKRLSDVLYVLSQLWLVGRTENMDMILPYLFSGIGLPPSRAERVNVTGETIDQLFTLTPELAGEIHRRNPVDSMLYSTVSRLERRFLERIGADTSPIPRQPLGFRPQ